MSKVQHKPIKVQERVQIKRAKDNPKAAWSGAPDCLVHHRTVSGAPGSSTPNLPPSGIRGGRSAIIHRTVRCSTGLSGVPSGATVVCNATGNSEQCTCARRSQSRRQKAHQTIYRTCPVHHRTVRWPHKSELQRSNPNGWVTWLAHRTVRCAHRQQPLPTATLVVGAINTPNHHTSRYPSFQPLHSIQEL